MSLNIREFAREDIPKAVAKWLRNELQVHDSYSIHDMIGDIESGRWLEDFKYEN